MFTGLGATVNFFLRLHILWKRKKGTWMSNSDKHVHPTEILCSHLFIGNFYIKGISFLYEVLKQLGQVVTSEMSLFSSLEYGGVSSDGALPGGKSSQRCLVLNGQKWTDQSCWKSCTLSPTFPNHGEGQPCIAFGISAWTLWRKPLSI